MSPAAMQSVHTTGINWESLGAIVGIISVIIVLMLWYFDRRDRRRLADAQALERDREKREDDRAAENMDLRREFTSAITNLSEVLTAKLETKETVARISERLAHVEGLLKWRPPDGHQPGQ